MIQNFLMNKSCTNLFDHPRTCLKTQKIDTYTKRQNSSCNNIYQIPNLNFQNIHTLMEKKLGNRQKVEKRNRNHSRQNIFQKVRSQIKINLNKYQPEIQQTSFNLPTNHEKNISQTISNIQINNEKNKYMLPMYKQAIMKKLENCYKDNCRNNINFVRMKKQRSITGIDDKINRINKINAIFIDRVSQDQIKIKLNPQYVYTQKCNSRQFVSRQVQTEQIDNLSSIVSNTIVDVQNSIGGSKVKLRQFKKQEKNKKQINYWNTDQSEFKILEEDNDKYQYNNNYKKQPYKPEMVTIETNRNIQKKQVTSISKKNSIKRTSEMPRKYKQSPIGSSASLDSLQEISISEGQKSSKISPITIKKQENPTILTTANPQNKSIKSQIFSNPPPIPKSAIKPSIQQQTKKIKQDFQLSTGLINFIAPTGEVAGYCLKYLKKSKINWYVPSILLYKNCLEKFKQYEGLYIKAESVGVITANEKNKFFQDNTNIGTNLQKLVELGRKKNKISDQYEKLMTEKNSKNLGKFIQKQVIELITSTLQSNQKQNIQVLKCLLMMNNSVKILAKLQGYPMQIIQNIEEKNDCNEMLGILEKELSMILVDKIVL